MLFRKQLLGWQPSSKLEVTTVYTMLLGYAFEAVAFLLRLAVF